MLKELKSGDKVRCIKTVIMQGSGVEAFTEGKWYEITGDNCEMYLLINNQGNQAHYWTKNNFAEYFTTDKRLIDLAMEKTGLSKEVILRGCPHNYRYQFITGVFEKGFYDTDHARCGSREKIRYNETCAAC